jgi:Transposase DDE domain
MDWHVQLITLYLAVCKFWQEGGWAQAQRYAPYADLSFTDEEVITLHLFGIMEKRRQIKDIHRHAQRYWGDWFPRLPGYGAYVQRLNRVADCFPTLLEKFCETGEVGSATGLVDSMPVCLARQGHRFKAKVAPELANSGYGSTKKLYYYGVKIHLIGDQRFATLPRPRFIGLTPAGLNDGSVLEQMAPVLPYQEVYADKAYEHLTRAQELSFTVRTPVKKPKGQEHLDAAEAWYSRAVSRVRQPIESIFNWIEEKTGIETASKVRSYQGLLVYVFGRLAAAMFMWNALPQSA